MLLTAPDRQRQVVAACCDRAARAGVHPGMPVAHARALFNRPDQVVLEPHAPEQDAATLHALALWAGRRFSPRVAVDPPDGLRLDITGCARLFHGEAALRDALLNQLAQLGFHVRAAIAPTYAAAWALVRFTEPPPIVTASQLREVLRPVPLAGLRLDHTVTEPLHEMGVTRIEHLLALPRAALAGRFGGALLRALDRALGHTADPIAALRPPPPPRVGRLFEGPTTNLEALSLTARALLSELCDALRERGQGARGLRIELVRSDLPAAEAVVPLTLTLGRPCRDAKHLAALLAPKLERTHLGFGVEAVHAVVTGSGALPHDQPDLRGEHGRLSDAHAQRAADALLDTLANRLGAQRVCRATLLPTHDPRSAYVFTPAAREMSVDASHVPVPADRPTVVFDEPYPAQVVSLSPDGPVHRVRWAGGDHAVVQSIGPERIGPVWWRTPLSRAATTDYHRIQDATGRWLWLAHHHPFRGPTHWSIQAAWA